MATGYRQQYKFQSTPSVWRETILCNDLLIAHGFQSTLSVWRETLCNSIIPALHHHFNPLPPCGGRRDHVPDTGLRLHISIHSLRVEGDRGIVRRGKTILYFNPLPPCGGRQTSTSCAGGKYEFQSTPSVWRETGQAQRPVL